MNSAQFQQEAGGLLRKLLLAILRCIALMVFMAMHYLLNETAQSVVPQGWRRSRELLESIFFIGFAVVYLEQVLEMIAVFVPRLQRLRDAVAGSDTSDR